MYIYFLFNQSIESKTNLLPGKGFSLLSIGTILGDLVIRIRFAYDHLFLGDSCSMEE